MYRRSGANREADALGRQGEPRNHKPQCPPDGEKVSPEAQPQGEKVCVLGSVLFKIKN